MSRKHKFVLISNWRCGCSTMANLFAPYSDFTYTNREPCKKLLGQEYGKIVHWPAKKIKPIFRRRGWNWDKYVKIMTVRNPWARIVSLYHYSMNGQRKRNGKEVSEAITDPKSEKFKKLKVKFNEYVKTQLPRWKSGIKNRWISYEMVHYNKGKQIVDYVIKIENLEKELSKIVSKHFSDFEFDYTIKRNSTDHIHYSYYYTSETRNLVANMFKWEIRKFKYKFERPPPKKDKEDKDKEDKDKEDKDKEDKEKEEKDINNKTFN